jgi:hypothetical protein
MNTQATTLETSPHLTSPFTTDELWTAILSHCLAHGLRLTYQFDDRHRISLIGPHRTDEGVGDTWDKAVFEAARWLPGDYRTVNYESRLQHILDRDRNTQPTHSQQCEAKFLCTLSMYHDVEYFRARASQATGIAGGRHLTWSDENPGGKCPACSAPTILVIAPPDWEVDSEADHEQAGWNVGVTEEITGHWCPECHQLRSLSFNS